MICGHTSWNENDVLHRYCGNCHKFHEPPPKRDHFQEKMRWCADMEVAINPLLNRWTSEWLRLNFNPPIEEGDTITLTLPQTRRLIAVAYALGKYSKGEQVKVTNDQRHTGD